MTGKKHGDQFSQERYDATGEHAEIIEHYEELWEPHNIVPVEPDEIYDNFEEEKAIHQMIDYSGIDYIIDPMDQPLFGVNHREHTPTDSELRFDIRADTGTTASSELDKVIAATNNITFAPRFGSRLKRAEDGSVEWFRVTDLRALANLINLGVLNKKTWSDGRVVAHMYDYDDLREKGAVIYDASPE